MENPADTRAQLQHDGSVIWTPPVVYKTSCTINVLNFPYDTQSCNLTFGSWGYTKHQLELVRYKQIAVSSLFRFFNFDYI